MAHPDVTSGPEPLYAARKGVYPKAVDGFYRRLKWAIMAAALLIYYVTPWLRWDRGPHAPDQAVLIDMANRRFYMFAIEIWPHEFYYIVGLLVMAGIGLFLVTSAVGRAWCGYACPQTVWTDLYQHVERFIDGDRNAQVRLAAAPWSLGKVGKRLTKWAIWLVIAFWTGGAWIMYFADAPTLVRTFWTGQAPFVAYATVGVLTATTFVLGGFMREQVCIYMCPWPRIQTAMMDEKSLLVTYRHWRGEPRGRLKAAQAAPGAVGDCIDCHQCVAVCPTGVDIREGPQIGCITCALCIDACDAVMEQVGRPRGLIDYVTLDDAEAEVHGMTPRPLRQSLLRPRTLVYFGLWSAIGLAMLFALGARTRLDLNVQQERNPLYVVLSDGHVRNTYTLKLRNMETRPRRVRVTIAGVEGAVIWPADASRITAGTQFVVDLEPDAVRKVTAFVAAPGAGPQKAELTIGVADVAATRGQSARGDSDPVPFERPAGTAE